MLTFRMSEFKVSEKKKFYCHSCVCVYLTCIVPTPSSLMLISSNGNPFAVVVGSDTTLICTLVLNSVIMGSENALLMVDAQLSRDGTPLALPGVTVTGTTFTFTTIVNSFGRSDSGNYTCTATVRPQPTATHLTGTETLESNVNIRAGKSSFYLYQE